MCQHDFILQFLISVHMWLKNNDITMPCKYRKMPELCSTHHGLSGLDWDNNSTQATLTMQTKSLVLCPVFLLLWITYLILTFQHWPDSLGQLTGLATETPPGSPDGQPSGLLTLPTAIYCPFKDGSHLKLNRKYPLTIANGFHVTYIYEYIFPQAIIPL